VCRRLWFDCAIRGLVIRLVGLGVLLAAVVSAVGPAAAWGKGAMRWQPPRGVDDVAPFADPAVLNGISCPSASLCVGVDALGSVDTSRDPFARTAVWKRTTPLDPAEGVSFHSVSCPSARLCVAVNTADGVGEHARIATSTDPAGGAHAWKVISLGRHSGSVQNIDCPTTSLCVIDTLGGLLVSTDPTGGAKQWRTVLQHGPADDLLTEVACPSASLCVVVGETGVYRSTDPAGAAPAWRRVASFPKLNFEHLSCASIELCVAVDENGVVVSSIDPAASTPSFRNDGKIRMPGQPAGVACATPQQCVIADNGGGVEASTDPSGPASTWTVTADVDANDFDAIKCLPGGQCIAPDDAGSVATSSAPAAASPVWAVSGQIAGVDDLTGISCPTRRLCVATDSSGRVVSSRAPARSGSAWRVVNADPGADLQSVSCPTTTFCAAIGASDALATSHDPAGGVAAWQPRRLKLTYFDNNGDSNPENFSSISCSTAHECVAGDRWYGLGFSNDPAGGAKKWKLLNVGEPDADEFEAVSCAPGSLCVAAGINGDVATSPHWSIKRVEASHGFGAISCPTASLCVATSGESVFVTTQPRAGNTAWKPVRIDTTTLVGVSCGSRSFCTAIDKAGRAFVSTDPTGGPSAWVPSTIDRAEQLDQVSCVSTSLCVAVDRGGDVIVGTRN
jgi:photosystem II stability/assembly factor-like uncharacterized protein